MASVQGTYPDQTWGRGLPGYFKDNVKPFVAQEAFQIPRENVAIPNIVTSSTVGAVNKRGFIDRKVSRFKTIRNYIENKKSYYSRIAVPDPLAGSGGIENIRYFARIDPLPFSDIEDYEDIKFWARYLHDNGKDPLTHGYAVNVFDAAMNDAKAARMRDTYRDIMKTKLHGIDPTTIERKTLVEVRQQAAQEAVDREEQDDANMEDSSMEQSDDGGQQSGGTTQPGINNTGVAPSAPGGGGPGGGKISLGGVIGGVAAASLLAGGGHLLGRYAQESQADIERILRIGGIPGRPLQLQPDRMQEMTAEQNAINHDIAEREDWNMEMAPVPGSGTPVGGIVLARRGEGGGAGAGENLPRAPPSTPASQITPPRGPTPSTISPLVPLRNVGEEAPTLASRMENAAIAPNTPQTSNASFANITHAAVQPTAAEVKAAAPPPTPESRDQTTIIGSYTSENILSPTPGGGAGGGGGPMSLSELGTPQTIRQSPSLSTTQQPNYTGVPNAPSASGTDTFFFGTLPNLFNSLVGGQNNANPITDPMATRFAGSGSILSSIGANASSIYGYAVQTGGGAFSPLTPPPQQPDGNITMGTMNTPLSEIAKQTMQNRFT